MRDEVETERKKEETRNEKGGNREEEERERREGWRNRYAQDEGWCRDGKRERGTGRRKLRRGKSEKGGREKVRGRER